MSRPAQPPAGTQLPLAGMVRSDWSAFARDASFVRWWRRLAAATGCLLAAVLMAGCAAQSAYRDGQARLAEGKLGEALERFDNAARLEPGSAEYRIAYLRTRDRLVHDRLAEADHAREKGQVDQADQLYRQVLQASPANERALAGLRQSDHRRRWDRLMREADSAVQRGDWEFVRTRARAVLVENPADRRAREMLQRANEAIEKAAAGAGGGRAQALAAAYRKPISIEFRDTPLKTVFEVISRSSGLNFVFDKDLRADQKASIFLKNSTIEAALKMLLLSNQLDMRVLDANSVLVFPNTAAKQKELQELSVRTFYLANADAKTVAATLKSLLKLRDAVVDEKLNLVIVRDAPDTLRVAERIVAVHDVPEAEVMLEVEILEIKRTRLLDLGVRWPDQISLTPLAASGSAGALTLNDLRHINSSAIGVAVGSGTIVAKKTDSDANILANPRIRARNREKAKIHIGERVPNITTTSTSTGFVSESVNYVDVGLKLDVEPTVYLDNEVAIKISLEVSNIINQIQTKSGTLAYQLGTRTATTVLRLRDGENQVLAGLINDEDRRTANKVPLVGELPILGRLFGSQADDGAKTEIVLSITPRILRNVQRPSADQQEFESGTETNVGAWSSGGAPVAAPVAAGAGAAGLAAGAAQAAANTGTPRLVDGATPLPSSASGLAGSAVGGGTSTSSGGGTAAVLPTAPVQLQWQGPTTARRGETITVGLQLRSDQPLSSNPTVIAFDPRVFQVLDVSEGDWLRQGGATTTFSTEVTTGGQLRLAPAQASGIGARGEGLLATVRLKVASDAPTGETRVQVQSMGPMGPGARVLAFTLPAPLAVSIAD